MLKNFNETSIDSIKRSVSRLRERQTSIINTAVTWHVSTHSKTTQHVRLACVLACLLSV